MKSKKDNTKGIGKAHKSVAMMIAVLLTASLWAMPMQAAASVNVFGDTNNSVIDSEPITTYHNASTIEQLNNELKILEETLSSLEENAVTGGLTEQEITKIQASKNKLSALDVEIKKEFADTKEKIEKIGSSKTLKRHEEVVAEYTTKMAAIQDRIASLSETKDRTDIKEKAENLKEEIQTFTSEPEYRPLSPKLPHRTVEPTKKKPYTGTGIIPAYYSSTVGDVSHFEVTVSAIAPTSDDLADTIDANQTQEIKDLAAQLNNNSVNIYEYVHNNIDYELYYGSRKGSAETLKQMGGNDFDQASLLIALYRASGIPARYVYGTIDIPIDEAMNWVGVEDIETAGNLLATAGVPTTALISDGEIVALRIEHVWVEAYVPYTNYRGVPISETGKMWIPLDPSFKKYNYKEGLDIPAEMGFDANTFLNDYISTMHNESPIELYVQNIEDYIAANHPNLTYDDVLRTRWIEPEWLGLLPATLPYSTVTVQDEYSEIPDNLRDKIRFYIHDDYGTLLDYTARMPEIAGKRVTLSYIAATPADQAVIDSYGGLYNTPPYLVDLKPVLKVAGNDTATGTSIGMGLTHYFDMGFTTWQGTDWIENYIISGNYLAIGLDTQSVPDRFLYPEVTDNETFAGEKLYRTAMDYLDRCDRGQMIADETMQMVTVKEISEVIASNDIRVSYLFGQPQTFEWKGLLVDADRCILGPFSVTGDASKSLHYMILSGMEGSISENRVFEDNYDVEAISGIKALEIASDLGIQIYDINSSNIGAILPTLSLPSSVKADIQNAVNQGWVVKVPAMEFAYKNWTGMGWIKMDPDTGEGGYMISGVTSGGQTVDIWPSALMDLFTEDKEIDHIEADITYPEPPDIYFAYMKDTINPDLYFEVTYTVFYKDGTSATVDEKYIPHGPYVPGYYTFYAGWGATGPDATRNVVVFKVKLASKHAFICPQENFHVKSSSEPAGVPLELGWTIEGDTSGGATVDNNGEVTAGPNAGAFTVKATVDGYPECFDTHTTTVLEPSQTAPGERKPRWPGGPPLTDAEWGLTLSHPVAALKVSAARNEAEAAATDLFGSWGDKTNQKGNAFLHAYWNYLMAKRIGADLAKEFGDAHENINGNPCADRDPSSDTYGCSKAMDLSNNRIGRDLVTNPAYSDYTDEQIRNLLKQMADNEELVTIVTITGAKKSSEQAEADATSITWAGLQSDETGLSWLLANQIHLGGWGDPALTEFRDTTVVVDTLEHLGEIGVTYDYALDFISRFSVPNNDFLSRKISSLAKGGYNVSSLVDDLLSAQNSEEFDSGVPNYPEGGWGIAPGYATDTLDTSLALDALNAAGMAGGLTVVDENITPGELDIFQFELPGDATSLRIVITELTGAIDFRIKQGTPPTLADPYYHLTFAPVVLSGLPEEPGTNYIRIDSTVDSTYSFEVSYVADGFDTRDLLTPLNYLTQAQNPDGGWGISSGAESNVYLTAKVLLTLEGYRTFFDLQTNIDDGIAWLLTKQNIDGGWGDDGSTIYESALSFYALTSAGVEPTDPDNATNYLLSNQLSNGSWNNDAYETALAVLALGKPMLTVNVTLKSGWNLISAPLNLTSWELGQESVVGDPLNVTPKNSLTSIYRYNTTSGLFEKCSHYDDWGWWPATGSENFTELEPGRGYWVMAKNDCNLTFTGTEPSDLNITLSTSWNLIGWYSMEEALLGQESVVGDPLNVTPKNSLSSIYRYNSSTGLFEKCSHYDDWGWWPATGSESFTKLEPGKGYWVMAKNDCEWRHKI